RLPLPPGEGRRDACPTLRPTSLRLWANAPSLLAGLALGLAPALSRAATRDIASFGAIPNDDRDDAAAIQAAIDASSAGDTVRLPEGTFLVNRTLHAKSGVKILGAGRDRTILKFNARAQTDFFDLSGTRQVELSGFTLGGGGDPNAHDGIFARTGGGHFIHHLAIQDLGSANGPLAIHFIGADGNYTNGVTDCVIADNTIRNIGVNSEWGAGIRLSWGSSRNRILRNLVDNTGRGGILANDGCSGLIISDNKVSRSGRKAEKLGIEVWGNCDDGVIEDNYIDHWLSLGGVRRVAARRNTIRAPAADIAYIGLEMIGQDLVVTDNRVEGAQQIGVSVSNNASNQWHYCAYNTIQNMVQWGAQLQGDKDGARMLYYHQNKFLTTQRGNPAAIYPGADGRGFRFNGNCQGVTLDGNEIRGNPAEGIELGGTGLDQISIVRNSIVGNGFAAVTGNPGADLEWANNTVTGNGNNNQLTSRGFSSRPPRASFTCPPGALAGQPVSFANFSESPDGRIVHLLWDFGEGAPGTQAEGNHTYSRAGIFRITLIVWDNHGRGAIAEQSVTVRAASSMK
ncbi:MAG: PKD domain-containing protein, partial [Limisphaerales bacterium]